MNKAIILGAVGLASISAASPWVLGTVAEQQFANAVEEIKQSETAQLTLKESTFERGYASSVAKMVFHYDMTEYELPSFSMVMESQINQLPIASNPTGIYFFQLTSEDKIYFEDLPEETQALLNEYMGDVLLSGHSHVNVFGNGGTELSSNAIFFEDESAQSKVEISPIKIAYQGNVEGTDGKVTLSLDTLNLSDITGSITLNGTHFDSVLAQDPSGLMVGSSAMNVSELKLVSPTLPLTLKDMVMTTNSEVVEEKLNTHVSYSIAEIMSPIPVTTANYDIELNGLSKEALDLLEELNGQSEEYVMASLSDRQYLAKLLNVVMKPGLELNQELKLTAFGGQVFADVDVKFLGLDDPESLMKQPGPEAIMKAINAYQANVHLKADNVAIMSTPAAPAIAQYIEQGLVVQTDTEVSSKILLKEGKLTINEREIPMEAVMQGLAAQLAEQ